MQGSSSSSGSDEKLKWEKERETLIRQRDTEKAAKENLQQMNDALAKARTSFKRTFGEYEEETGKRIAELEGKLAAEKESAPITSKSLEEAQSLVNTAYLDARARIKQLQRENAMLRGENDKLKAAANEQKNE